MNCQTAHKKKNKSPVSEVVDSGAYQQLRDIWLPETQKTLVDTEHIEHRIAAWTKIQWFCRWAWVGDNPARLEHFDARQLGGAKIF
jgi:hypothetical protein